MTILETLQLVLRAALAAAFVGMGIAHMLPKPARAMAAMIPPRLRRFGPRRIVVVTGIMEIAGGIALVPHSTHTAAGILLAVFLVAVFPANAYAARHPERFGAAAVPFWPRLAAQIALIALCLVAAL